MSPRSFPGDDEVSRAGIHNNNTSKATTTGGGDGDADDDSMDGDAEFGVVQRTGGTGVPEHPYHGGGGGGGGDDDDDEDDDDDDGDNMMVDAIVAAGGVPLLESLAELHASAQVRSVAGALLDEFFVRAW